MAQTVQIDMWYNKPTCPTMTARNNVKCSSKKHFTEQHKKVT